jgi:GNAT superfamily N-acetyltransferase
MTFTKIIRTQILTPQQSEQINNAWNNEYPVDLMNRFSLLLDGCDEFLHYIIEDVFGSIAAWGVVFVKENERRFSILVVNKYQGQGLGKQLIEAFKKDYPIFYGWVIDHDDDVKTNGEKYVSPLPFYLQLGFTILNEQRIDTEMISAVKVRFKE